MKKRHIDGATELLVTLALVVVAIGVPRVASPAASSAATLERDVEALVSALEGGWEGEDNMTPFGKMGFVLLFDRQADGSLHARSSLNSETYIDLRFSRDEAGRWILREEAGMEGSGAQAHSLVPAGPHGDMYRWVYEENPGYLTIDVGLEGDTMAMDVTLRGREHVSFRLDRMPTEALPSLRRELALAARQSPAEGVSIRDVVEYPPGLTAAPESETEASTDPVDLARREVGVAPESAEAHLALARALGEAINRDPATGPLYAFEMLTSLERSIELDPKLAEAYHWLVGYYLSAPPIAGGSIAKAEETARRLAQFDPQGGEELLAQVASSREGPE
jgi:hypothetical protein